MFSLIALDFCISKLYNADSTQMVTELFCCHFNVVCLVIVAAFHQLFSNNFSNKIVRN